MSGGRARVWQRAAVYGSLWAAVEIVVGSFLHNLRVPLAGSVLAAVGVMLMTAGHRAFPERGLIWRAALVCALMKSVSPSAVILGPMVGILMEGVLLEAMVRLFRGRAAGYLIGGALAVSWSMAQRMLNAVIAFGTDVVRLYVDAYSFASRSLGVSSFGPFDLIAALVGLEMLAGFTAAALGLRIGRDAGAITAVASRSGTSGLLVPRPSHHRRKGTGPFRVSCWLLRRCWQAWRGSARCRGGRASSTSPRSPPLRSAPTRGRSPGFDAPRSGLRWPRSCCWPGSSSEAFGRPRGPARRNRRGRRDGPPRDARALRIHRDFGGTPQSGDPLAPGAPSPRRALGRARRGVRRAAGVHVGAGRGARVVAATVARSSRRCSRSPTASSSLAAAPAPRGRRSSSPGRRDRARPPSSTAVVERLRARGARVAGILAPGHLAEGRRTGFDIVNLATGERKPLAREEEHVAGPHPRWSRFAFSPEGLALGHRALGRGRSRRRRRRHRRSRPVRAVGGRLGRRARRARRDAVASRCSSWCASRSSTLSRRGGDRPSRSSTTFRTASADKGSSSAPAEPSPENPWPVRSRGRRLSRWRPGAPESQCGQRQPRPSLCYPFPTVRKVLIGAAIGLAAGRRGGSARTDPVCRDGRAEDRTTGASSGRPTRPSARKDIVLVAIDQSSVRNLEPLVGRWPWPRMIHASLLDYLARAPAKVIVYDVIFAERDRRSFKVGDDTWTGEESDRALAEATAKAGNVVHVVDVAAESGRRGAGAAGGDPVPARRARRGARGATASVPRVGESQPGARPQPGCRRSGRPRPPRHSVRPGRRASSCRRCHSRRPSSPAACRRRR